MATTGSGGSRRVSGQSILIVLGALLCNFFLYRSLKLDVADGFAFLLVTPLASITASVFAASMFEPAAIPAIVSVITYSVLRRGESMEAGSLWLFAGIVLLITSIACYAHFAVKLARTKQRDKLGRLGTSAAIGAAAGLLSGFAAAYLVGGRFTGPNGPIFMVGIIPVAALTAIAKARYKVLALSLALVVFTVAFVGISYIRTH